MDILQNTSFLTKYEDNFIYNDYLGLGMLRAILTVFVLVITGVFPQFWFVVAH